MKTPTTKITLRLFSRDLQAIKHRFPDNYNAAIRKIIDAFVQNKSPEVHHAESLQEFATLVTSLGNEVAELKDIMDEIRQIVSDKRTDTHQTPDTEF